MKTIFQLLIPDTVAPSRQAAEIAPAAKSGKGEEASFTSLLTLFLKERPVAVPAENEEEKNGQPKLAATVHMAGVFTNPLPSPAAEGEAKIAPITDRQAPALHPEAVPAPEFGEEQPQAGERTAESRGDEQTHSEVRAVGSSGEKGFAVRAAIAEQAPSQQPKQPSGPEKERPDPEGERAVWASNAARQTTAAEKTTSVEVFPQPKTLRTEVGGPAQMGKDTMPKPVTELGDRVIQPMPEVQYFHQEPQEIEDGTGVVLDGPEITEQFTNTDRPAAADAIAWTEPDTLHRLEPVLGRQNLAENKKIYKEAEREAKPLPAAELPPTVDVPESETAAAASPVEKAAERPKALKGETAPKMQESVEREQKRPTGPEKPAVDGPAEMMPKQESGLSSPVPTEIGREQSPGTTSQADKILNLQEEHNLLPKLTHQIRTLVDGERSEVRIRLKPDHLGEMRIKLSLARGVMVAEFAVQSEVVREIISSSLPQLHTALQDQGTNVAEMTVNIGFGQENSSHDLPQRARQFTPNGGLRRSAVLEGKKTPYTGQNPWHQIDLKA